MLTFPLTGTFVWTRAMLLHLCSKHWCDVLVATVSAVGVTYLIGNEFLLHMFFMKFFSTGHYFSMLMLVRIWRRPMPTVGHVGLDKKNEYLNIEHIFFENTIFDFNYDLCLYHLTDIINYFQIPISTLKAVSGFLTNTAGNTNISIQKTGAVKTGGYSDYSGHSDIFANAGFSGNAKYSSYY